MNVDHFERIGHYTRADSWYCGLYRWLFDSTHIYQPGNNAVKPLLPLTPMWLCLKVQCLHSRHQNQLNICASPSLNPRARNI